MTLGADRIAMAGGKKLPYDAEVEYIQSSGSQYINTLVVGGEASMTMTLQVVSHGTWDSVFGGANSSTDGGFLLQIRQGTNSLYYYGNGTSIKVVVKNVMLKSTFSVNSSNVSNPNWGSKPNYVFTSYKESDTKAKIKLYALSMLQDGVLVRDFIPVRFTNENGVSEGALYDKVSKQLFRNAGTGAFTWAELSASANGGGYKLTWRPRRYTRSSARSARFCATPSAWEVAA